MEDVRVFDGDDDRYLSWLDSEPRAYVLNVRRSMQRFEVLLHQSVCRKIREDRHDPGALTTRDYVKIAADAVAPLLQWHAQFRPKAVLRQCKKCFGQDALTLAEGDTTIASSGFWWVNHKQTHRAEIDGRYIWSPKVKANGGRNQSYDNLTLVQAGDTVISYSDGKIKAIGVAKAVHREEGKPEEFGSSGDAWGSDGWLVPIEWQMLKQPISPKAHLDAIRPLLPERHSPIQPESGNGNQGVYLAAISAELGQLLLRLAGQDGETVLEQAEATRDDAQADQAEAAIAGLPIASTEKEQLVMARRGQGAFRLNVSKVEPGCRLTGTTDKRFLIASHIKPWSVSGNAERLDGHNGFLLSPHVDQLFDGGWISFADDGLLLVASPDISALLAAWGIKNPSRVGSFTDAQKAYLAYHRAFRFARRLDTSATREC